jgi:UDP-glucose 4-epimerase
VDFKVEIAPRRPGDPARIVAASDRARTLLGWAPQYDDLATIIAHSLTEEEKLQRRLLIGPAGAPPKHEPH